jgi:hypothetical protein
MDRSIVVVRVSLLVDRDGGRYVGARVPQAAVAPYVEELGRIVGRRRLAELEACKAGRDGADEYHVTAVPPPQYSDEIELGWRQMIDATVRLELEALGRVEDGPAVSYYVIAASPEIQRQRSRTGLAPANLHVTLGFAPNDIYHLPKDRSTRIGSSALAEQ